MQPVHRKLDAFDLGLNPADATTLHARGPRGRGLISVLLLRATLAGDTAACTYGLASATAFGLPPMVGLGELEKR